MFVMAEMVLPIQGVVVQNRSTRLNCFAYQAQTLNVKKINQQKTKPPNQSKECQYELKQ